VDTDQSTVVLRTCAFEGRRALCALGARDLHPQQGNHIGAFNAEEAMPQPQIMAGA